MIKHINAGIYLESNYQGSNNVSIMPTSAYQSAGFGMMRYNPSTQSCEVFDGTSWIVIGSSVDIKLSYEAVSLLNWVKEQRDRQARYKELAKTNVTIADALEKVEDAESKLREIVILCETESG